MYQKIYCNAHINNKYIIRAFSDSYDSCVDDDDDDVDDEDGDDGTMMVIS